MAGVRGARCAGRD